MNDQTFKDWVFVQESDWILQSFRQISTQNMYQGIRPCWFIVEGLIIFFVLDKSIIKMDNKFYILSIKI